MAKLDCKSILRTMSEYIDGELGDSVCKDVEDHLTTCRKCRFHVDAVKYTIKMFDEWRADDVPPDAMIRLRHRLTDETGCVFAFPAPKARRKTSPRKPVRRKSAAARKKAKKKTVARKKPAGKKKTAARKPTRKKPAGKKKTAARKPAPEKSVRKRPSRKKPARKRT